MKMIKENPQHTFQLLTKRPFVMSAMIKYTCPDNAWAGVTAENQKEYSKRFLAISGIESPVRWISCEPLLSPITLNNGFMPDWVVIGCESGRKRRRTKLKWIESLVGQCVKNNIPVWVKQIEIDGKVESDIEKFPKHLQIRQFPNEHSAQ